MTTPHVVLYSLRHVKMIKCKKKSRKNKSRKGGANHCGKYEDFRQLLRCHPKFFVEFVEITDGDGPPMRV